MAAVDLGAQSGRVALGRFDGATLELTEVHRFPNRPVRAGGVLQWDILRLYQDVLDGLGLATREASLDSIAVDSWAVDFGLLDRSGRLIRNPVHYRDARRAGAVERVLSRVPPRELHERTGIQLMPINTVFELAAMAEESDPALEMASTLLLIPDLIHHWLCGSSSTEFTNATTTQCYDPRAGVWASSVLERLDIPFDIFPAIMSSGTPLGPLSADVAQATGAHRATVVAGATHDTAAAVAAVPLRGSGSAFLSVGTWSLVGVETGAPLINAETFAANLTNEGGVSDTVRLLKNVTGLWLVDECRRTWAAAGEELTFEELVVLAEAAPSHRAFINPDDPRFAAPGDMPHLVVDFCLENGQTPPEGVGAVVRCILESLALRHAQVIDLLASVTRRDLTELHVVGGGARNDLLCAWTAEASGRPVLAGPEEATLLGNLLVQAIALGEIGSLAEARDVVSGSFTTRTYEPTASAGWQEARERFSQFVRVPAPVEMSA